MWRQKEEGGVLPHGVRLRVAKEEDVGNLGGLRPSGLSQRGG